MGWNRWWHRWAAVWLFVCSVRFNSHPSMTRSFIISHSFFSGCASVGCWVSGGGETGTAWLASRGPEGPCGIVETQLAEASRARERGLLALNRSRVYRVRPCTPPRDHVHALHLLKRWAIRGPCPNSKPEYAQCGCRCTIHVALELVVNQHGLFNGWWQFMESRMTIMFLTHTFNDKKTSKFSKICIENRKILLSIDKAVGILNWYKEELLLVY